MARFFIDKSFLELFPDIEIGVVVARGIDNRDARSTPAISAMLEQANVDAMRFLGAAVFIENKVVSVWREAFYKFRTRRGAHASIENLLKRASKGNAVGSISPLVDIYNSISLEHALPIGGEDLDTFEGDLRLTVTKGGDPFTGFGDEEDLATLPGEVAYLDDAGAVCRCFNWRDGKRTMLTPQTKNAFLIIESVDPDRSDDLRAATEDLASRVVEHLGGIAVTTYLDASAPEMTLDDR